MPHSFSEDPRIGGTMVDYYFICRRQVWLMAHGMEPDKRNELLRLGRLLDAESYGRERKGVVVGDSLFDILRRGEETLVVGEVKKSSRAAEAAAMQLAHYLYVLRKEGVVATGELLFPKEKRRERVELTEERMRVLDRVYQDIRGLVCEERPPAAEKIEACTPCAYAEWCWG